MICASITSKGEKNAIKDIRLARKYSDIIELRLDCIGKSNIENLISECSQSIATFRKKEEGGCSDASDEERFQALNEAAKAGATYIDIEMSSYNDFKPPKGTKLIVSYHNFKETPKNLDKILKKILSTNCEIAKIAVMANDIDDNLKVLSLLKQKKKVIGLCMGKHGVPSRILYKKFGGFLTYASVEQGKESAPGQMSAKDLSEIYGANKINEKTEILSVIGSPDKHSSSPAMFNKAYRELGLNMIHVKFPVTDISKFFTGFHKIVSGCAVTIPHKESVIEFLDKIDPAAKEIGAVNTIVFKKGKSKGYNTDVIGGIKALKEASKISGKAVVIIGAGGAAKAMAFGINKEKGKLIILNRTESKANEIATKYHTKYGGLDLLDEIKYDILINCSSVGMQGEKLIDASLLRGTIMDCVYMRNGENRLIKDAIKKHLKTVKGKEMLLYQALDQFKMWTGKEPPVEIMRAALHES